MSDIMEKLLAEEKEAEKLMYGEDAENAEIAPAPEEEIVSTDPEEDLGGEIEPDQEPPKPKPKRENWKKRFIGLQKTHEEVTRELKAQNASLVQSNQSMNETLTRMSKELEELKKAVKSDPFEGVFTEEDENLLGKEALDAMKKAASAVKPEDKGADSAELLAVKAELDALKQKDIERANELAMKREEEEMEILKERLSEIVPGFEKIDVDPGFGEYLKDVDSFSDHIRMDLFTNAVVRRDVANVARFYQEYLEKTKGKESFVDEHITPTGDGAAEMDPNKHAKKRFHISEYEKFMDDQAKGRFRGREKEAQKLEMMFDKAFMEDRIYE